MIDSQVNHEVTVILLRKIIELLGAREEPETLRADEVRAALHNELAAVVKSINSLPDNKDILKELRSLQAAVKAIEFNPSVNVAGSQVTIPEIKIPEIRVPDIPAPNVTVNVPDVIVPDIHIPQPIVNVEAPIVNVPEVDLAGVIQELHVGLEKLRTNNKSRPLAVRLTDGGEWIKKLEVLGDHAKHHTQFLSDVSYIRDAAGNRINPATSEDLGPPRFFSDGFKDVTTAGTRVPLLPAPIPIRHVIITAKEANTGTVWIGGTNAAAGRGRPLVALQSEKIEIDYINKIYIDSTVNGEGVTFIFAANDSNVLSRYLTDPDGTILTDPDGNPLLAGDGNP